MILEVDKEQRQKTSVLFLRTAGTKYISRRYFRKKKQAGTDGSDKGSLTAEYRMNFSEILGKIGKTV